MKGCFLGYVQNEMSFDKLAFPKNQGALFGATQNFAVGKFVVPRHVRKFELPILRDFALKLQTSKGLGHFPETDVGETRSEQDIVTKR